jgi:hypothetical protein
MRILSKTIDGSRDAAREISSQLIEHNASRFLNKLRIFIAEMHTVRIEASAWPANLEALEQRAEIHIS